MEFTALQIAELLEGEVQGNPDQKVSQLSKIERGTPGTLSFLSNPKYAPYLYTTKASIVILDKDYTLEKPVQATLIRVEKAYQAFTKLLGIYSQIKNDKQGIETPSFISKDVCMGENNYVGAFVYIGKNVKIGNNVKIYPNAYIGDNTTIGDDTIIYAGVKIYDQTQIGKKCIIHAGAVIGADGFGYTPDERGVFGQVPQIGNVIIEDNVDIGANTTVDRATLGSTIIKQGVKLDNLIQIAHNVIIGKHTAMAAQTGIAGSTKVGAHSLFGGQCAVIGHLKLGDYIKAQGQSGITKSLKSKSIVQGSPAIDYKIYNKSYVYFKKLSELFKRVSDLEKEK